MEDSDNVYLDPARPDGKGGKVLVRAFHIYTFCASTLFGPKSDPHWVQPVGSESGDATQGRPKPTKSEGDVKKRTVEVVH